VVETAKMEGRTVSKKLHDGTLTKSNAVAFIAVRWNDTTSTVKVGADALIDSFLSQ
jgi:hypothetical protein